MKQFFLKNKWSIIIIVILLIIIATLFSQKQALKYSLIEYQSIPRIGLHNTLDYSSSNNLFSGEISGFVAFNNIGDQPHNLTQYFIIEPTNKLDEKSNQVFSVGEILALAGLAPSNTDKWEARVKGNSSTTVTLGDDNGNQFFIDKLTKEISMTDKQGDKTKLITSDTDYRTFMWKFLTDK